MPEKIKLLSPEKVRVLSASPDLSSEEADRHGDRFFEAGRTTEAMLFYERSKNPDKLRLVLRRAIEEGDAFLLFGIEKAAPDLVEPAHWSRAGESALTRKRYLFAQACFEKAEDPERAYGARQAYLKIFAREAPASDPP